MKIDFKIITDETNDVTYEIWCNDRLFADIAGYTSDQISFHPVAMDMTLVDRMKVLTTSWQHWDALDSWSDITFELVLS